MSTIKVDEDQFIPIFAPVLGEEERQNVLQCVDTGWISSQGDFIIEFEQQFAKWHGVAHGVATSNCTTALHLALAALDIGPGDEVICPDLTFIAPANMIRLTGATPVLVDIEEPSWAINPNLLSAYLSNKTRAIVVVHPFGHVADMDPIVAFAAQHDLHIIEDVAEAPGAFYKKDRLAGTFGAAACYSFFANKIMTTGEGGMVLLHDAKLNKTMRIYRDHGMSRERRYVHEVVGFNYRMTNMQAAVGVAQLHRLRETLHLRDQQQALYRRHFVETALAKWRPVAEWCRPVHWLATITLPCAELRDPLLAHMKTHNIDGRQMVYPVHEARPYAPHYAAHDFPVATSISQRSLHLPSSLNLQTHDIERISSVILEWLERHV